MASETIIVQGLELNAVYIVIAVIAIPLLLGFLTEAGKDLYNMMRKKKNVDDFMKICAELRSSCQTKETMKILREDNEFMMGRQDKLRDEKLPTIERSVIDMEKAFIVIKEQVKTIGSDVKEMKSDIKNIQFLISQVGGFKSLKSITSNEEE